jgi:argininosuccinate lyase
MTKKVWGGRFSQEPDALVNMFNASIGFDRRLYAYDIEGSVAHCRMLAKQGIISDEEASSMLVALGEIKRELDHGGFSSDNDYEDIHALVEKSLVEKVGALGEKIHTGRSRNDQVALDTRLYVRDVVQEVMDLIRECQKTIVITAENNLTVLMPGYTHLAASAACALEPPFDGLL